MRGGLPAGNPRMLGSPSRISRLTLKPMSRDLVLSTRAKLSELAGRGNDWLEFADAATAVLKRHIAFDRVCWHTVDPGTILFTGAFNHDISCSGTWLAEHEYVIDDVTRWWSLARSGQLAGASSIATHGDLDRSARHRSHVSYGIGDELRGSFVTAQGGYWGAVGLLRDEAEPWFTAEETALLAAACPVLAEGFMRASLAPPVDVAERVTDDAPGVVVFDAAGRPEWTSPAADHWIDQLPELPRPATPAQSRLVEVVASRARSIAVGADPLGIAARSRVRTRTGRWLLVYGTNLYGGEGGRTAVIIQPAPRSEITPIIALAYGLTAREREVVQLCMQGLATKHIARALGLSQYTVQDHLKAIFNKTGARTRGELLGQVFLEHYVPRWEPFEQPPAGWGGFETPALPAPAGE